MIGDQFVKQKLTEYRIQEFLSQKFARSGYSHTEIHRTPLGEKIVVYTTRPGLVVGKKGEIIKELTIHLKKKFKLENPEIEIGEVKTPLLDVRYVADKIAFNLERYGSKRFKSVGYKVLQDIMDAGAIGAEVVIAGKLPSARARTWRFSAGYLKKSGDISMSKVHRCTTAVDLKSGTIGIKVSIMTPDIQLPDKMILVREASQQEVKSAEAAVDNTEAAKPVEEKKKKPRAQRKKKEETVVEKTDGNNKEE